MGCICEIERLREMVHDLYCIAFEDEVSWKAVDKVYEKYHACDLCKADNNGKSPCAYTSKDLTDTHCKPHQARAVAEKMRELGIEVDDGDGL